MASGALDATTSYYAQMPRKSAKSNRVRPEQPDWYLPEWMRTLNVKQAHLARECGWTDSTMHGIYHGRTSYYRDILNLIASKLNVQPYELLMPPELAMAFRQFQASAQQITTLVHDNEPPYSQGDLIERRAAQHNSTPRERKTGTHDR
jgi:hypothetical protein